MTNAEILTVAAMTISESTNDGNSPDYKERAPYLIASFCTQCASLDARYRQAYGMPSVARFDQSTVSLNDEFPLVHALSPAATLYLASMLVMDENEELGDRLYDRYTDALATVAVSLPTLSEKIVNKY